MLDNWVEKLSEEVGRRRFLGRAVSSCSALSLALLGFGEVAFAGGVPGCCNLCSTIVCRQGINCSYQWCWTCTHGTGNQCTVYTCLECYSTNPGSGCTNSGCDGTGQTCNCNVTCSKATNTFMPCL